jgi:RNA polymerase-binding transcription factor DksA
MARKPKPLTLDEKFNREVETFKEQSQARAKIAQRAYDAQDGETRLALDTMVDRIVSSARGIIVVRVGKERRAIELERTTIQENALYLATEILKDLALNDIRVANYRFPDGLCVECGKEIKPKKKARNA